MMKPEERKPLLSTTADHSVNAPDDGPGHDAKNSAAKPLSLAVVAIMLLVVQTGFGAFVIPKISLNDESKYGIMLRRFCGEIHANALVVSFYRDALAFPVLIVAARVFEGPLKLPRLGRDLLLFCGLGLSGMFGGQLFYILGVFYAGPDVASVVQPAMPVWTAIFVVIVGAESIPNVLTLKGALKVLGVLCAAGGAACMLVAKGAKTEYPHPLLGAIFSLTNTLLFAMYITIQKLVIFSPTGSCHARWASTPVYVTAWSYGFGAIFMALGTMVGYYTKLTLFGFEADSGACDLNATYHGEGCHGQNASVTTKPVGEWSYTCVSSAGDNAGEMGVCHAKSNTLVLPTPAWYALIYAVFITSALNYGLITVANKNCRTSVVSAFWPFQVFVNCGLAWLVFGDVLNIPQMAGGLLIIIGLFAVLYSTDSTPATGVASGHVQEE